MTRKISNPPEVYRLLQWMFVIHVVLFVLMGSLCDCGELSIPGMQYCLLICPYVIGRFGIYRINNRTWPTLTFEQHMGLKHLPLWGLPLFVIMFHSGQALK